MQNYSSIYTIDIKVHLKNGIETELEELEENKNISFSDDKKRNEFINDVLTGMLEKFENDMNYYGGYTPNFKDAVSDTIIWDKDYYGITVYED